MEHRRLTFSAGGVVMLSVQRFLKPPLPAGGREITVFPY